MTPKEILDYFTAKSKETPHPFSFVDLAHWTHALMQQQANALAACQQERDALQKEIERLQCVNRGLLDDNAYLFDKTTKKST